MTALNVSLTARWKPCCMPKSFFVYMMANRPNGTLYIGVTSDLVKRVYQHRNGAGSAFTARYNVKRLVWYEPADTAEAAIIREKRLKKWNRAWKIHLIEAANPEWRDLWLEISGDISRRVARVAH